jgi:hypothetical protein
MEIMKTLNQINHQQQLKIHLLRDMPNLFVLKLVVIEGYLFEKDGQTMLATPVENVSQEEVKAEGLSNVNLSHEAQRLA